MRFKKLLNQYPSKWSTYTNRYMIDHLFIELYLWILYQDNLSLVYDFADLKYYFYCYLFNVSFYTEDTYYDDYFDMKYSESIIDLFIEMKDITKSYGSSFLYERERTADSLLMFIHFITEIEQSISDDELEDEFNNYDEIKNLTY